MMKTNDWDASPHKFADHCPRFGEDWRTLRCSRVIGYRVWGLTGFGLRV